MKSIKNKSIFSLRNISSNLVLIMLFYYVVLAYPIDIFLHTNYLRISDFLLILAIIFGRNFTNFNKDSIIYIFLLVILVLIAGTFSNSFNLYLVIRQIRFIVLGYLTVITIEKLYNENFYNKFNKLVIICALFSCLWLLRQYFFGWTEGERVWIVESMNSKPDLSYIGTTRFFATFPFANNASLFFALSLVVSLEYISTSLIFKIGFFFSLLGLVLVQMKVGYFVGVFILIFYFRKIDKIQLVFIVIILLYTLSQFNNEFFRYTLNKFNDDSMLEKSMTIRLYQISKNNRVYLKNPIFILTGNGYGMENRLAYIDNFYFSYFYQNGLISTVLIIGFFKKTMAFIFKNINSRRFVFVFFSTIGLYSLFSNAFDSSIIFYIFTVYLGFFIAMAKESNIQIKTTLGVER